MPWPWAVRFICTGLIAYSQIICKICAAVAGWVWKLGYVMLIRGLVLSMNLPLGAKQKLEVHFLADKVLSVMPGS